MNKTRNQRRIRRHRRVRKTISGTAERGRLAVFRSGAHIYAQIIDDSQGRVLAAASSLKLGNFDPGKDATRRIAQAQAVGKAIAEAAKEKGIGNVVFDRGGYRFHGRVAALAQAARESGLQF